MNKNHITDLLPDYLDNLLMESQRKKVEAHLETCTSCAKEMDELKSLFHAFDSDVEHLPSSKLKTNFLEQLEAEKAVQPKVVSLHSKTTPVKKNWASGLLKIAASVLLLVGAFFLGRQQSQESANKEIALLTEEKSEFKQTAMLSLMENKSASRRIQGVNYTEEYEQPDEAIIKALADRMLYDENVNVRASALAVLAKFISTESVVKTFIEAIKAENDPGIQIEIIQILGKTQEKKAVGPMQKLMEREGTQPFVKKQIEAVLPNII